MSDDNHGKGSALELRDPRKSRRMSREAPREEERDLGGRDGVCKGPGCVEHNFRRQKDGQSGWKGDQRGGGVGGTAGQSLVPERAAWGLLSTEVIRFPNGN